MKRFFFILAASVVALSSCHYVNGKRVSGNGNLTSEQRSISGFTGVESHGSIDIIATQGNYAVKVETDQNLLQYIETIVRDGRLVVRFKDGISVHDVKTAKVYVTAPSFNAFETHGSGNINGEGKIANTNRVDIEISGSGNIQLNMDCPTLKTATHGSGNMMLSGETKDFSCETSGSGNVKAADLKAESVTVSIHGSGNNEVFASESLNVEIFGSGDVHYRGEPKVNTAVHGSGSVSRMN